MTVPTPIGSGSITAITTGTGTISKTGCTKGNFLLFPIFERGVTGDWSGPSSVTNVTRIDESGDFFTSIPGASNLGVGNAATSQVFIYCGRVKANGTCSANLTVGASGNDLFGWIIELKDVIEAQTIATLFENITAGSFGVEANTNTTILDSAVTTLDIDRMAFQFVFLSNVQTIDEFIGETGGDWIKFAEVSSGTGATAAISFLWAAMPRAGTINGGTETITSIAWGTSGSALIGKPSGDPYEPQRLHPKFLLRPIAKVKY